VPEITVSAGEDAAEAARQAADRTDRTGERTAVWVGPAEGAPFAEFVGEIGRAAGADR
jgi:hypothetical protein